MDKEMLHVLYTCAMRLRDKKLINKIDALFASIESATTVAEADKIGKNVIKKLKIISIAGTQIPMFWDEVLHSLQRHTDWKASFMFWEQNVKNSTSVLRNFTPEVAYSFFLPAQEQ